jgi:CTP:molybdopterin cytidylyltransferase MocA
VEVKESGTLIPGLILAAGRSIRMGKPKALLSVGQGGPSFVRHLALTLLEGGVADVLVVGRPDDQALRKEIDDIGLRFVPNPDADSGQLSSVLAGLNAADRPGVAGLLVTPVDAPLVGAATVRQLLAAIGNRHLPLVRATHKGRHGHPVVFARRVFDELRHADPGVGAKAIVQRYVLEGIDLEVDDAGVLLDIDEPVDYERAMRRLSGDD